MIGLYCGYLEWEIDEISYNFYKDLIAEIAVKLQFNCVSHILAKDHADETVFEYVNECNPFMVKLGKEKEKEANKSGKKLTLKALQASGLVKG